MFYKFQDGSELLLIDTDIIDNQYILTIADENGGVDTATKGI